MTGPWPFVTRKVRLGPDGQVETLTSRHHRKALGKAPQRVRNRILSSLWQPRELNWWIGFVFAMGSALFAIGSVFYLAPGLARTWSVNTAAIDIMYFAGSIPFTTAAYLQLYQAANAPVWESAPQDRSGGSVWLGWRPRDIGWVSSVLQFAGTLLFNINTFDAMSPGMTWFQEDLAVWGPDLVGSVLFLVSGYLAFAETCHKHFAWMPGSVSWWVTFFNLLGCVAFMTSAVFAFTSPPAGGFGDATLAVTFTLFGAIGFLVGSILMFPESVSAK